MVDTITSNTTVTTSTGVTSTPVVVATTSNTAVVDVVSSVYSKINWTQAISVVAVLATFLTGGKLNIDPQTQVAIVTTIATIAGAVTVIFRTWFNGSVPPSAVK